MKKMKEEIWMVREEIIIMKKNLAVFLVLIICSTFIFACGKADSEGIEDIKAENDTKIKNDTEAGNGTEDGNDTEAGNGTEAGIDIEAESNVEYWLCGTGIPDGPDYTGGICKVYFKQNAVVLEGNMLKSMSQEDYGEQIGTIETYEGEEIEVSADCVIVQDEGNEEKTYSYEEYIEIREITETDNVAGVYMVMTIKNGKVIEIYYSS